MINSLVKDSHMPQSFCHPNFGKTPKDRTQNENLYSAVKNGTIVNTSDSFNKPARNVSFGGFLSPEKLAKSKRFCNILEGIERNPLLFEATFALGLTCFLRPASIVVLPSDKKNKTDNLYAAAHSIASGIISYMISLVVTNPISAAMKKVEGDIEKKKGLLFQNKDNYLSDKGACKTAGTFVKKLPEAFVALPRATITIALIPVILKYVFGIEKKKPQKNSKMTPISENLAAINQNKLDIKEKNVLQPKTGNK